MFFKISLIIIIILVILFFFHKKKYDYQNPQLNIQQLEEYNYNIGIDDYWENNDFFFT